MNDLLADRIHRGSTPALQSVLRRSLRGIERETLRVDPQGRLAMTAHPGALGSALTHPQITTDYSESLLEFITPAESSVQSVLADLDHVHRHVAQVLAAQDEMIWAHSMPASLPSEEDIPIAHYGSSHIGRLKHVYRRGLAVRYGRRMQCIAGVHFNYSVHNSLWDLLTPADTTDPRSMRDKQSDGYLALIRNFRRYSWLLMLLFGASPAVSTCFLSGRDHGLQSLSRDTLFLPYATSLRMSDLGYQNDAQSRLRVPCDTLENYVRTLSEACRQPHPAYESLGVRRGEEWVQMSPNVLQIENEYYATIRPKRVTEPGERPLEALLQRGIQYVEVRCLDIDPFEPLGLGPDCAHFVEVFLLYCALLDSPMCTDESLREQQQNFSTVVRDGRRPGQVLRRQGRSIALRDWAQELLDGLLPVARWLDDAHGSTTYTHALSSQSAILQNLDLTPSARVLAGVDAAGGFQSWARQQSERHARQWTAQPLSEGLRATFSAMAETSLQDQAEIEAQDMGTFEEFLQHYLDRVPHLEGLTPG